MNSEIARIVVLGIAGVCFAVWLVGVVVVWRTYSGSPQDDLLDSGEPFETGSKSPHSWVSGTATVDGEPEDVIHKATNILATNATWFGPTKIVEQTERTLRFLGTGHPMGTSTVSGRSRGPSMRRGMFRARSAGHETSQIDYDLETPGLRLFLVLAVICQVVGFLVLVGLTITLYYLAAESFHPAIRTQSIQMIHVGHFLWPPFLLVWFYRRFRNGVRDRCEAFLHNLSFATGESSARSHP
ncbi:MAG: hypothetical protein ACFCD0_21485 [Gemmataceae bacterium]